MSVEITKEINIDFYNPKLITVFAKQYDKLSRYILVTCYNQGKLFLLDKNVYSAEIQYSKPDGKGVLKSCKITDDGKVLIELTEQMLVVSGTCYADLVIRNDNGYVVSSMNFCVKVFQSAMSNSEIESSSEFNMLNDLIEKTLKEYDYVIDLASESADEALQNAILSKSYAVGGTNTRSGEDTDNAKHYYEQAKNVVDTIEVATIEEVKTYIGI